MSSINKNTIIIFLTILAAFLLFSLGWCSHMAFVKPSEGIRIDTLRFRDTTYIDNPVPYDVVKWKTETITLVDTVWIADNEYSTDTLYVDVPMEKKSYKGEDYMLTISGFNPNLDFIAVFPETTTVTTTVTSVPKAKKVTWGISVGPTVCYDGKMRYGIGGTAGLVFNF